MFSSWGKLFLISLCKYSGTYVSKDTLYDDKPAYNDNFIIPDSTECSSIRPLYNDNLSITIFFLGPWSNAIYLE